MTPRLDRVPDRPHTFTTILADLDATMRLGAALASWIEPGDVITLDGDLGAGKTALVRAMIREYADDPTLEVPSPTFPLLISYEFTRGPVAHADLYRIADDTELDEIGLLDVDENTVVFVEWPDRAGNRIDGNRLDIFLTLAPEAGAEARRILVTGRGAFGTRIDRFVLAERLIEASGFGGAERRYLQGDASTRSYMRLVGPERSAILMNAPRRPDGPPIRYGLPYSRLVHLAEDVKPFVAVDRALRGEGFSAPEIYAADLDAGLLVLEDFGTATVLSGDPPAPVRLRYETAMDVLAALHGRPLAHTLHIAPRVEHKLPPYDNQAFLMELELLIDWYLPSRGVNVDGVVREEFLLLWRSTLAPVQAEPKTWVLRDFHSPNLMWLEDREDLRRIGLIDFQDAVLGPAAYDVASLAQDARVDIPEQLELHLVGRYVKARREADPAFDARAFTRSYAVMGAQRATKILGVFTRLNERDGKPQYLRHIPRVRRYLARCLGHQDLGALRAWYEATLPSKDLNP